jgi:hypothetical protein
MCKLQVTRLLAASFLALALGAHVSAQSDESESPRLKSKANASIEREDVVRAEEHAESLRAKLFDLQVQELELQSQLEYLDYRLTPDSIQRALAFVGSTRPMDELRDGLRARLEGEKARVNKRLELLAASRERLEAAINRADAEVERLRQRLNTP